MARDRSPCHGDPHQRYQEKREGESRGNCKVARSRGKHRLRGAAPPRPGPPRLLLRARAVARPRSSMHTLPVRVCIPAIEHCVLNRFIAGKTKPTSPTKKKTSPRDGWPCRPWRSTARQGAGQWGQDPAPPTLSLTPARANTADVSSSPLLPTPGSELSLVPAKRSIHEGAGAPQQ